MFSVASSELEVVKSSLCEVLKKLEYPGILLSATENSVFEGTNFINLLKWFKSEVATPKVDFGTLQDEELKGDFTIAIPF